MTATNHALTGALIGLLLPQPFIAVPLAIVSHFVCDAIPHFGMGKQSIHSNAFTRLLKVDVLACGLLVAVLALLRPEHWVLAAVTAFLATSPDFMWLPKYVRAKRGKAVTWHNDPWLLRFHAYIQWFERPIGAAVELAWLGAATTVLTLMLV